MKITVAKNDLADALRVVSACKSNTGNDLSAHYLFKVTLADPAKNTETFVEVAAYSGQTYGSSPIQGAVVEGEDADAFTIEGWRLEKWLGAVPDDGKPLSFTYTPEESKTVEARATKGVQRFGSLDPSKFPTWDNVISKSVVTATLSAQALHSILSYAGDFVGDDETKHPEQTVAECKQVPLVREEDKNGIKVNVKVDGETEGVLFAMAGMHAVQIKCPALNGCTMRVHGKDIKGILAFLATLKDGLVDLLEDQPTKGSKATEPTTLILRPHRDPDDETPGPLYGENRWTTAFPELGTPEPVDHYQWPLPKEEVIEALPFLEAGAPEKDTKLRLSRQDEDTVMLAMRTPRQTWTPLTVSTGKAVKAKGAPDLPEDGFMVNKDSFKSALKAMPGDTPIVGVSKLKRGGYLRLARDEGPDGSVLVNGKMMVTEKGKVTEVEVPPEERTTFLTVVAWVK
jgi:hypothetical protein